MKLRLFFLCMLLAVAPFSGAGAATGAFVEMGNDDRAKTRAWAQWWLIETSRNSIFRTQALMGADRSFERGHFNIARKRYLVLAAYGDKFAQFRLGLISLERDDPVSAWAWFELANEDGSEPAFAPFPGMVWEELNGYERQAAQTRLEQRLKRYSDYGLAQRMHRQFRQRLRMTTGSRLGYVGYLIVSDGAGASTNAAETFYGNLKKGLEVTQRLVDNYGNVTLGDLEVREGGDAPASAAGDEPGPGGSGGP